MQNFHKNSWPKQERQAQSQLEVNQQFMETITRIIQSLSLKHPKSSQQFTILNKAIKQYHSSLLSILAQKNKQLMYPDKQSKSSLKLLESNLEMLLQQIQMYFKQFNRCYSDPNIAHFEGQFHQIREMYEFRNVDINKFLPVPSKHSYGVQVCQLTSFDRDYHPKFDEYQKQIQLLRNKIKELIEYGNNLEDQNVGLREEINTLQNAYDQQRRQLMDKINKLKQMLESIGTNRNDDNPGHNTYRSQPEIPFNKKSIYHAMLKNTLDEMDKFEGQKISWNPQSTKISHKQKQDEWRMIYLQSTALQKLLDTAQI